MSAISEWTREYFERGYAQRWGLSAPSDHVRMEAGGHGRHALALAERGADVVGLDFAVALLTCARDLAAELRTQARWIRGDMWRAQNVMGWRKRQG